MLAFPGIKMIFIEIIIGGLIALLVLYAFRNINDKRSKKFFAGSLLIAALIYVGFAVSGFYTDTASENWLLIEFLGVFIYFAFAYLGVKVSVWFLAIGWAMHVFWDVGLHFGGNVAFVPGYYPSVCIGFDIVFAIYIAYRFYFRKSI